MKIKLHGSNKEFKFSDEWQQVKTMPEDPPRSIIIMRVTEYCQYMVLFYPIDNNKVMPFENPQSAIDGIHDALSDDQGIIEVESIYKKNRYIYSIIKTKIEPHGMQYCLTLHFDIDGKYYNATGFFDEKGITGTRDTTVYGLARRDGIVDENMNGWSVDPYDPTYKKGILMNVSENKYFDEMFPFHPLSEIRKFIKELMSQI
jgi:hypothetical protein